MWMAKLDHKWIFWSLAVHWYQKQSLLRPIFAARGQRMKLVIDEKFIGKKLKIWKFWAKPMLCTSKESLEHVEFRFRCKKIDFFEKIKFFSIFRFFFPKGGPFDVETQISFFLIFQNFQKQFLKMASMRPKECWMKQSHVIWAHLGHPPRSSM